jgi:vitamin B12 transporter
VQSIELGLRQNFTNDFGSYLNPSVGTRWNLTPSVALRANFATVQRNPGLDQLYVFDTVHGWLPNPNLKPETGTNYTAGIDVSFAENLTGQFTYFGSSLSDRQAITNGRWDNIGLVTTNGLEAAMRWNISPEFYSSLSYTYTDAKIGSGAEQGLQLSTLPYSVGKLGLGYESAGWQANIFLSYASGSRRALFGLSGVSNLDFSPAYLNLDLSAKIPLSRNFALNLYLENLADVSYEKTNRIFQPGLTYRLGVQATF